MVAASYTLEPLPQDGTTTGELLRGNTVLMGYLKNEAETRKAFASGWFHTGDIVVVHETALSKSLIGARTSSYPAAKTFHPLSGKRYPQRFRGTACRGSRSTR